jgi:hypothetical protein
VCARGAFGISAGRLTRFAGERYSLGAAILGVVFGVELLVFINDVYYFSNYVAAVVGGFEPKEFDADVEHFMVAVFGEVPDMGFKEEWSFV